MDCTKFKFESSVMSRPRVQPPSAIESVRRFWQFGKRDKRAERYVNSWLAAERNTRRQ